MLNKYALVLRWSEADGGYLAHFAELPTVVAFGDSREDALAELEVAASAALEVLIESGHPVPVPHPVPVYSGQFRLRVPPSLHEQLSHWAEAEGTSLNGLICGVLSASIASRVPWTLPVAANRAPYSISSIRPLANAA